MTLFKQMMIAVITFSLVIFIAVGITNFNTISYSITTQLSINARHTANSLGLAIKQIIENPTPDMGDFMLGNESDDENRTSIAEESGLNIGTLSTVETMMNSMFDSGYYSAIRLVDVDGKVILENSAKKLEVLDVPDWFIRNIKLEAPIVDSEIMRGWSKFGILQVQSSTGAAYRELYHTLLDIFYTLGIMSISALFAIYFGLKLIFAPLKRVQAQAEAVLENRFIIQDKIPFTLDIKQIVLAINSMVEKAKDVFEQSAKMLNKYEDLLYKDEQTGLFNRRYFVNEFGEYLASEEYSTGCVMILRFKELGDMKKQLGFEKWQKFILNIVKIIKDNVPNMLCARINDDEFIVAAHGVNTGKMSQLGGKILDDIKKLYDNHELRNDDYRVSGSIVEYNHSSTLKDIFIASDVTLARASEGSNFALKIYEDSREIALGKEQYKELIVNSLENNMFKFAGQKVASSNPGLEHHELFIRLVDKNGKWQMASYFMPMANELNFAAKIDLYVLNKVANMLKDKTLPDGSIAINLGKDVLSSMQYFNELEALLRKIRQNSNRNVYIEIPNKGDMDIAILAKFHQKVRELGLGLGLDHFGLDAKSIDKLKDIGPDYIKIQAGNLIDFFGESSEQKHSFDIMMRSKNIKIIALGVENQEQKNKLEALHIDSMQGNFIHDTKNIG